jgi:hypothetical protein
MPKRAVLSVLTYMHLVPASSGYFSDQLSQLNIHLHDMMGLAQAHFSDLTDRGLERFAVIISFGRESQTEFEVSCFLTREWTTIPITGETGCHGALDEALVFVVSEESASSEKK